MHKKRIFSLAGISALGAAALLLSGCGGSSFSKQTFGNYAETLPAAYGLDPIAINPNLAQTPIGYELSGLSSPDGKTGFLTGTTAFTILQNPGNATLPVNVNAGTGTSQQLPLGFSTGGSYIDANAGTSTVIAAVQTGASVTFRAALANGVASNNAPPITGATLNSTDPEWTLGTLPMTFSNVGSGPLANGTYVTGANGTPAPFTLPFTQGIHTVTVTVTDAASRSTATTFEVPVAAPTSVTLFLQSFTVAVAATSTAAATTTAKAITAGDLVSLDGGTGVTADAQGTAIFFTTPGTHTVTETDPTGKVVQTSAFAIDPTSAGKTLYGVPVDNGSGSGSGGSGGGGGTGSGGGAIRQRILSRH